MALGRHVVYALRLFRRQPGIVGMTIAGLAVAIGISTAAFTLADLTLLPRHGIVNPNQVGRLAQGNNPGSQGTPLTHSEYLALKESVSRADMTGCFLYPTGTAMRFTAGGDDEAFRSGQLAAVSGDYFALMGVGAAIGRTLSAIDDATGASITVVLRHRFWTERFSADASVIGRTIWYDGAPATIVGVADPGFAGACAGDIGWTSLPGFLERSRQLALAELKPGEAPRPIFDLVSVLVRPRGGETLATVQPGIDAIVTRLKSRHKQDPAPARAPFRLKPVDELSAAEISTVKATGVLITLLLLLACANVTNLLLASAAGRVREIGTRVALGAGRGQVVRMLLTESVLFGLAGGAGGLVIAAWATPTLAHMMGADFAVQDLAPNVRIVAFMVLVAIGASVVAGLAPARLSARLDVTSALNANLSGHLAGLSGGRLRATLVALQSGIAIVLLMLAGIATRTLQAASNLELGADVPRLVNVVADFKNVDDAARREFVDAAKGRLRGVLGVEASSRVNFALFGRGGVTATLVSGGSVGRNAVDADFFATSGIRVVRGRTFSDHEVQASARVAVISEKLAETYWNGASPIGDSMERLWGRDDAEGVGLTFWNRKPAGTQIIGVVSEARTSLRDAKPVIYLPLPPATGSWEAFVLRVADGVDPDGVRAPVRDALRSLNPRVVVTTSLASEGRAEELAYLVSRVALGGLLGMTALALALVGLFGVAAFAVAQRRHEVAVRVAMGAGRWQIVRLLVGGSLWPVLLGLSCGLVVSQPVLGILHSVVSHQGRLFGVTSTDVYALVGAIATLLAAGLAAAAVPARNALKVNAAEVLKRS